MKNITIILMITLVLSISPVFSEKELESSKKYNTDSTLTINGTDYTVKVGRGGGDAVGLLYNGSYILIHESDCIDFGKDQLCLHSKLTNTSAVFNFYDLSAKMEYRIYANDTDFIVGEERQYKVIFNNTGASIAEGIKFRQEFSEGITVSDVYGCQQNGNNIYWSGFLKVDSIKNCKYNIILDKPGNAEINSTLSYTNFGENETVKIDDIELNSYVPFNYSLYIPNNVSLGERFTLELNITANMTDTNLTFHTIKILDNDFIKIIPKQASNLFKDEILRSRRATFNKTLQIKNDIEIMKIPTGEEIRLLMSYSIDNGDRDFEHTAIIPFNISTNELTIRIVPDEYLVPGQESRLSITASNTNEFMQYTKIVINATTDIKDFPRDIDRLGLERIVIPFTAPLEPGDYQVNFTFFYYDKYKNEYHNMKNLIIHVKEPGDIKVKKSIDYKDENGAKLAYMTISVKNELGVDIQNLTISEVGPFGNNSKTIISMNDSETREVIKIPIRLKDLEGLNGTIETETVISYTIGQKTGKKISAMAVNVEQMVETLAPTIENLTETVINTSQPDVKDTEEIENNMEWITISNIFGAIGALILIGTMLWLRHRHKNNIKDPKHFPETKIEHKSEKILGDLKEKIKEEKGKLEGKIDELKTNHTHHKSLSLHDQLSILDDEITTMLNKVEKTPELIKEASAKEQEYIRIKAQIDNLPKQTA